MAKWLCKSCGQVNEGDRSTCEVCGAERPKRTRKPAPEPAPEPDRVLAAPAPEPVPEPAPARRERAPKPRKEREERRARGTPHIVSRTERTVMLVLVLVGFLAGQAAVHGMFWTGESVPFLGVLGTELVPPVVYVVITTVIAAGATVFACFNVYRDRPQLDLWLAAVGFTVAIGVFPMANGIWLFVGEAIFWRARKGWFVRLIAILLLFFAVFGSIASPVEWSKRQAERSEAIVRGVE